MNVLDSQVEALAFNYFSYGLLTVLNNLWTWVALFTAALSFWKIRSAGCPKPKPRLDDLTRFGLDQVTEPLVSEAGMKEATEVIAPRQTEVCNGVAEDVDAFTKGKFTVYYEEEEEDEDMQCRRGKSEGLLTSTTEGFEECESEWWKCWEGLLRLRNGENESGWYTWQDLTELNGNVVRLWDGGLRFGGNGSFTKETWYSSSWIRV